MMYNAIQHPAFQLIERRLADSGPENPTHCEMGGEWVK